MTKKVDTDERNLDEMLEGLAKPKPLEHKEQGESSQGRDAVEYQAAPHAPAARVDHNTFPDAPIIVNQTNPGVAPPANPLNVTPEERKRLEADLERRRKAKEREERNADTAPRRTDPPGVTSDPPGVPKVSLSRPLGALALVALLAVGVAVAMRAKTNASSAASASTSAPTASAPSVTAHPVPAPTVAMTATTTVAERPTATATHEVPHLTSPVHTAAPTATQTNAVHPPATAVTTSEPTATVTAPPGFKPGN